VGVVIYEVLACVFRVTTKKVVNFFGEEKCTVHPREILATPMSSSIHYKL